MTRAQLSLKAIILVFVVCFSFTNISIAQDHDGQAQESHSSETGIHDVKDNTFNASDFIQHHIADSHEFHIATIGGKDISLPLPLILWTDNGLVTFMSSAFHHDETGKEVVTRKGQDFVRVHGNVYYKAKIQGMDAHHLSSLNFGIRPINLSLTKNAFSMILSVVLLFFMFSATGRHYKKNKKAPKGIAGFLEPLVLFVRDDIAIPNIGKEKYAKFMPYLLSVFFFIWMNNLIGLVPFFPFSSNLTGNIAFTFTLALITFLVTIINGNKNYWGHIFAPPVPKGIWFLMIPVEIIGMFTKPFALMVRLFANIAAGHIIILSLVSLIFIFGSVYIAPVSGVLVLFMSILEMLVAALQAYVFTLLSALFIGQAVEDHH